MDCAGAAHDVVLCTGSNCPLWEWRFGSHWSLPANRRRVESAFKHHPVSVGEVKALGIDISFYLEFSPAQRRDFVGLSLSGNQRNP